MALSSLLSDQGMHVLRTEFRQAYSAERRDDVKSDEVLVTTECHWARALLRDLVQPEVHVVGDGQPLVDNRSTLCYVALDLRQPASDLPACLAIDPLPFGVDDDARCPASVSALQDRALAITSPPRAHRRPSLFDAWPRRVTAEPAANALEGTVLRVPCQPADGRADTGGSPASTVTSWTSRMTCTMRRTVT